ncbi:hypothetical protein VUR80DRAFT_9732 [Thermomyces stellatus]
MVRILRGSNPDDPFLGMATPTGASFRDEFASGGTCPQVAWNGLTSRQIGGSAAAIHRSGLGVRWSSGRTCRIHCSPLGLHDLGVRAHLPRRPALWCGAIRAWARFALCRGHARQACWIAVWGKKHESSLGMVVAPSVSGGAGRSRWEHCSKIAGMKRCLFRHYHPSHDWNVQQAPPSRHAGGSQVASNCLFWVAARARDYA